MRSRRQKRRDYRKRGPSVGVVRCGACARYPLSLAFSYLLADGRVEMVVDRRPGRSLPEHAFVVPWAEEERLTLLARSGAKGRSARTLLARVRLRADGLW